MSDLAQALMQARNNRLNVGHETPPVPQNPFDLSPETKQNLEKGLQDKIDRQFDEKMEQVLRDKYGPLFEKAERCAQLWGLDLEAIDRCMQEEEIGV